MRRALSVYIDEAALEKLRDAAYWLPGTSLSDIVESAVVEHLERLEQDRGGPFDPRPTARLKAGRPMR